MPYNYNVKWNIKDNIEGVQKILKSEDFEDPEKYPEEKRKELYASIFAARMAGDAERNKRSSLRVKPSYEDYQRNYTSLMNSKGFDEFIKQTNRQDPDAMKKLLTEGRTHGGAAEDSFKDFLLKHDKTPSDVPDRWMPTAEARINHLKTKVAEAPSNSDEAVNAWAEIFCTRRAVGAVSGKSTNLDQKINGRKLADTPDLASNEVFKAFVKESTELKSSLTQRSHGGWGETLFRTHIKELHHIPEDTPEEYMPTAYDRAESLKTKIKNRPDSESCDIWLTELMATREAVNAKRKKPETLKVPLPPGKLNDECEKWEKCKTFKDYLNENSAEARKAGADGHGGLLQEKFRSYLLNRDHIPDDVPESYLPTGYERLEVLHKKYEEADYYDRSPEDKLTLAAEIMATRASVDAKRGEADSLKAPMNAVKFNDAYKKWTECKPFRDYVMSTDPKIQIEVRDAAHAGHGGALGEKFREHVVGLDTLDEVPNEFTPNARVRTEALKNKIAKEPDADPERKQLLYAELLATRSAVEAERNTPKTLDRDLYPEKVKAEREKLLNSQSFKDFLSDPDYETKLRDAVNTTRSHGGLVEDHFREYILNLDHIPADVPVRYMPQGLERVEQLKQKLKDPELSEPENEERRFKLCAELMAIRTATGAVRKQPKSMEKPVDPEAMQQAWEKWSNCTTLQNFLAENGEEAMRSITATHTHGGEFGDKFRDYVKKQPAIGTDVPEEMLPTVYDRIEALKKEIKDVEDDFFADDDTKLSWYAQVLATRSAADAKRNDPDALKNTKVDPKAVEEAAKELTDCPAFRDFLEKKGQAAAASITARHTHGGDLEEKFKEHVAGMDELPENVPARYAPTAYARIEALKKKISGLEAGPEDADELVSACAELLGARRSVGAKRNSPDSLKIKVQPKEANAYSEKLKNCEAFKDFVQKKPKLVKSIITASHTHGGELEEKFREHVLNMDKIPAGVPKEYMPTALERCEALKKKIKSSEFKNKTPEEQNAIYKELIATRAAVNSVRGDKKTLDLTVNADKLHEIREELNAAEGVGEFFRRGHRDDLRDAAAAGHGGELDDKLKTDVLRQTKVNGVIPDHIPERFLPKQDEIKKELTAELKEDLKSAIPAWFDSPQRKESYMRKAACLMYIKKREQDALAGRPVEPLNHENMKKNVDALKGSNAFKRMFEQPGATRELMKKISENKMSEIFTSFAGNGGRFYQPPAPQPVAQNQLEQQQQQQLNQNPQVEQNPQVNRNQQPEGQNQPVVQQGLMP